MTWETSNSKARKQDFISGILFAVLHLIAIKQTNIAKNIISESGYSLMSFLQAQKNMNLSIDAAEVMNEVIKSAFNK